MNWDDIRFVLAVVNKGSLLGAAKALSVDHTTVGRRIEAAERALGVRLFTRTTTGYVPTADADRLLSAMADVEKAVLTVERNAQAQDDQLAGIIRVTSPETLGTNYLAQRLAEFGIEHPGVVIELLPAGTVLDLSRREAEVAIRPFRSKREGLVLRKVATVSFGFYAAPAYLKRNPLRSPEQLVDHRILCSAPGPNELEPLWLAKLNPNVEPAFVSTLSTALLAAARTGAGVAILPRYLGDADKTLRFISMPSPPSEPLWLTVHRDLRSTPRVRALLDYLSSTMKADAPRFAGAQRATTAKSPR